MIQELNLSPLGYLVLLVIVAILAYLITTAPSKTEDTVEDSKNTVDTPEYLSRYGAVIQMQGR